MADMFCGSCGGQLAFGSRFCGSCGAPVQDPGASAPGESPPPAMSPLPLNQTPMYMAGQMPGSGVQAAPGINGYAIASLVLSLVFVCGIGSILAVVFGHYAQRQISERGGEGAGMAQAGLIIGWVGIAVVSLYIGIVVIAAIHSSGSS